jgi:hypothetical protein
MTASITVSGKQLGRTKPLFSDWMLSLPSEFFIAGNSLLLKDLLTQIVLEEVEAFRTRQESRKLTHVLSQSAIEKGVTQGKIDMGGKETIQDIDVERALESALQSFEDGFYFVFIDDVQYESLEQIIKLKPDSQLLFLRLVPLVGG